jgi:hypothetical protein
MMNISKVMGDEKMRYTRYELKKRKSGNKFLVISLVIILGAGMFIGTSVSKLFFRNNQYVQNTNASSKANEYVFLQCGIFSKKQKADVLVNSLSKFGTPVEIKDEGKIKVVFGIYKKDDYYKKAIKLLSEKKVDVKQIDYELDNGNIANEEIAKIIDGDIQIINKLGDSNVKGYYTTDFKTWSNKLEQADKNDENSEVLIQLKNYVKNLPQTITKDNIGDNIQFIYNELKKLHK